MDELFFEPFLKEQIDSAKARASNILDGKELTEDGLTMQYRFELCRRYHIGIFSQYFEERTLGELALEVFMWREFDDRCDPEKQKAKGLEEYKQVVTQQTASGKGLFGDEEWQQVDMDKFMEKAKKDFQRRKQEIKGDKNG